MKRNALNPDPRGPNPKPGSTFLYPEEMEAFSHEMRFERRDLGYFKSPENGLEVMISAANERLERPVQALCRIDEKVYGFHGPNFPGFSVPHTDYIGPTDASRAWYIEMDCNFISLGYSRTGRLGAPAFLVNSFEASAVVKAFLIRGMVAALYDAQEGNHMIFPGKLLGIDLRNWKFGR